MDELQLLQSIYASATQSKVITIGPGDDMGELLIGKERLLCAVDQLIVGRHVQPDVPPKVIGYKAIARCFSDIAAMCATPVGSLMTACVSSITSNEWCDAVFTGAKEAAERWGGPIFGGDIASCDETSTLFTVTALAKPGPITTLRTGAQAGDFLCATGELGNAIQGHHLTFTPRITEAQELLEILGSNLHSMIDISDGLGLDASHLASDSLQLVIDTASLPLRKGASIQNALSDGEDYELLFTTSKIPEHELVTVIGQVQERNLNSPSVIDEHGNDLSSMGWEHT